METRIQIDSDRSIVLTNVYKAKIGLCLAIAGGKSSSLYELDAEELLQAVKAHHAIAKQSK